MPMSSATKSLTRGVVKIVVPVHNKLHHLQKGLAFRRLRYAREHASSVQRACLKRTHPALQTFRIG